MKQEQLEQEIKELIIESLDLEDITSGEIKSEDPLFIDGLGLDSIDALELGIALKKKYNLTLKGENKDNKEYFYSVRTLAAFVAQNISQK
ncbi:MAG: acyl carrier protein [Rickettsiales bacterium]|jgi:acyl carrier protein